MRNRHPIRDSKIRDLIGELEPVFGPVIGEVLDRRVELARTDDFDEVIIVDDEPLLVKVDGDYVPHLGAAEKLDLERVTVDMGAVPHISDGAHVMAPGVVDGSENIESGDIVAVQDEENQRVIAIGRALCDGSELVADEGKVVRNLHTVGDDIWELKAQI